MVAAFSSVNGLVLSGLIGYTRKETQRKKLGKPRYRSGKDSLEARVQKKLTEKYNWFRNMKKKNGLESFVSHYENHSFSNRSTVKEISYEEFDIVVN